MGCALDRRLRALKPLSCWERGSGRVDPPRGKANTRHDDLIRRNGGRKWPGHKVKCASRKLMSLRGKVTSSHGKSLCSSRREKRIGGFMESSGHGQRFTSDNPRGKFHQIKEARNEVIPQQPQPHGSRAQLPWILYSPDCPGCKSDALYHGAAACGRAASIRSPTAKPGAGRRAKLSYTVKRHLSGCYFPHIAQREEVRRVDPMQTTRPFPATFSEP